MSESEPQYRPPRPIDKIQQDYAGLCAKAGDIQYKIDRLKSDLVQVNKQLRDLNFEAVASSEVAKASAEAAAKAKAEAEAAAKPAEEAPVPSAEGEGEKASG